MLKETIERRHALDLRISTVFEGDSLTVLRQLPSGSVQSIITSPPYWGLRDYEQDGQIGLEESLPQYINKLVTVFSEPRGVK